jgi:hypothetical protein
MVRVYGDQGTTMDYIPITIQNIIHRPVFYLKQSVSETGLSPFQVEPTQMSTWTP